MVMFYCCLYYYWFFWMVVIFVIVRLFVLYEIILINIVLFKLVWVLFIEINMIRNYKDYNFSLLKWRVNFEFVEVKFFFKIIFVKKEILYFLCFMMWKFWYFFYIFGVIVVVKIIYKNLKLDCLLIIDVWWWIMGFFVVIDVNCEFVIEWVLCVGVLLFY